MTLKVELSDNKIMKTAFESISRIVDEATIIFDTEGMRLTTLDRSHITFISLEFKKTLFDEYECTTPEQAPVDVNEFMKVLKKCKSNDILRLSVDEGNLIIIFDGDATRKFKLRLIDSEYEPQVPPKINHSCNIQVPIDVLVNALNDMDIFSERLQFMVDENYLIISADGEFGDAATKYLHGENILEVARSSFTIKKLLDIMKSSKFTNTVEIGLGNDMPLVLTLTLPTHEGSIQYLLAPRIEEQE